MKSSCFTTNAYVIGGKWKRLTDQWTWHSSDSIKPYQIYNHSTENWLLLSHPLHCPIWDRGNIVSATLNCTNHTIMGCVGRVIIDAQKLFAIDSFQFLVSFLHKSGKQRSRKRNWLWIWVISNFQVYSMCHSLRHKSSNFHAFEFN